MREEYGVPTPVTEDAHISLFAGLVGHKWFNDKGPELAYGLANLMNIRELQIHDQILNLSNFPT